MIASTAEQIIKELKELPFTMIAVLSLIAFAVFANNTHANAGEVKHLTEQVSKVLTLQMAESLRNLQVQLCSTENHEARRTLSRTIDDLQTEYRRLTGARYPLTACG